MLAEIIDNLPKGAKRKSDFCSAWTSQSTLMQDQYGDIIPSRSASSFTIILPFSINYFCGNDYLCQGFHIFLQVPQPLTNGG